MAYGGRIRTFIAIDIEDPLLLSRIERLKDTIASTGVPMKLVETGNIHLTLRFIGEISRDRVDEIIESVLKPLKGEPFEISLKGLGAFPSVNRPRVVWIGVEKGADVLKRLKEAIEDAMARIGFPRDRPGFVPHITLARIKGSRNLPLLVRVLNEYQDYEIGETTVYHVRLKKSTLTRSGPIYETLWEVRLG
ncbi:MAG: RNA 2',3'-cyclic phosphodiesterase [Desulfurococcales archaeon]|nr:RNA 2',3'-cyclic phosphodiesterase [Desulfurococcales archaeon]